MVVLAIPVVAHFLSYPVWGAFLSAFYFGLTSARSSFVLCYGKATQFYEFCKRLECCGCNRSGADAEPAHPVGVAAAIIVDADAAFAAFAAAESQHDARDDVKQHDE